MPLTFSPGGLPSRVGAGVLQLRSVLVSPFNMELGCYAQVGVMELSEFCLFLVGFPATCISNVSPRVYLGSTLSAYSL
jgi:hypothetical protein